METSPKAPLRADWRYLRELLGSVLTGKVEHVPAEYNMLSRGFMRLGGSWVKVFQGDPAHVDLLKQVIKLAYKQKLLTRKYKWGQED